VSTSSRGELLSIYGRKNGTQSPQRGSEYLKHRVRGAKRMKKSKRWKAEKSDSYREDFI